MARAWFTSLLALSVAFVSTSAQVSNSWPHDYPGKPSGDFSPEWQSYFEVTKAMLNVTFPVPRNWAGNIPVDRPGHPNDTLFFWAFEKEDGSMTAKESIEPWGIWLNGGPGSSSMIGLFFENGPIHVADDYSLYSNNHSWDKLADYIWIDQPVGTGYSTADATGFVADEDQTGQDFMNFLSNLVKIFPGLRSRPLHLTGESYAGRFIPYITKAYFGMENPPVNLISIAIGNGAIGNGAEFESLSMLSVIETYPQLIGYDTEVYEYFKEQTHLCGYDLNLTYPQSGHFPTLNPPMPTHNVAANAARRYKQALVKQALVQDLAERSAGQTAKRSTALSEERLVNREQWKRNLSGRANGTIDPWYQCDLTDQVAEYALNFSLPWKGHDFNGWDWYYVPDALDPETVESLDDASIFLNNDVVRAAIHAPISRNWTASFEYPFGSTDVNLNEGIDPTVEPMAFLSELATNATERDVRILIYSGNDDYLVGHLGSEVIIQNTTFGGIQGFTRRPSTPWFGDDGQYAGIVHQERNWTFVLVDGAGHLVPQTQPQRAFVLLREFILGNNQTGLVTNASGTPVVIGGENATLAQTIHPGQLGIYVGSASTQSTYTYPSATIASWNSFFSSITSNGTGTGANMATNTSSVTPTNGAGEFRRGSRGAIVACIVGVGLTACLCC